MILLGGFGRSAHTRGWAVLDGLRSKELKLCDVKFCVVGSTIVPPIIWWRMGSTTSSTGLMSAHGTPSAGLWGAQ